MEFKQLNCLPKALLDDIVKDQCLPIIGAGFSLNAIQPKGFKIPLWHDLGKLFSKEMNFTYDNNPIDTISAYSYEFSKPKLIEKLSEFLLIDKIQPGSAHIALANLYFKELITTNFDELIEKAYDITNRKPRLIIDEEQLAVNNKECTIIKMHGDLNHPNKLVATEEDYDLYISKNPLLCTYISNLMISKTPLFIGYSLDDPDSRQLWQIIGDRLGKMRRSAYLLAVELSDIDRIKYERRGVKVVLLNGKKSNYNSILTTLFKELRHYWMTNVSENSIVVKEGSLPEFTFPNDSVTRLCFFSIPIELVSLYKTAIFPIFEQKGFVPIIASDIIDAGDNSLAKIETMIEKSFLVVIDYKESQWIHHETLLAVKLKKKILIITENINIVPLDIAKHHVINRPSIYRINEKSKFLTVLEGYVKELSNDEKFKQDIYKEPRRLYNLDEYRASIISAISLLENGLRSRGVYANKYDRSLFSLIENNLSNSLSKNNYKELRKAINIRNKAVHSDYNVTRNEAKSIIDLIYSILDFLNNSSIS